MGSIEAQPPVPNIWPKKSKPSYWNCKEVNLSALWQEVNLSALAGSKGSHDIFFMRPHYITQLQVTDSEVTHLARNKFEAKSRFA
jgi:hypothetical protein